MSITINAPAVGNTERTEQPSGQKVQLDLLQLGADNLQTEVYLRIHRAWAHHRFEEKNPPKFIDPKNVPNGPLNRFVVLLASAKIDQYAVSEDGKGYLQKSGQPWEGPFSFPLEGLPRK